jgi:hypothetical protein
VKVDATGAQVDEVLERWDRRLAEAVAAWHAMPASEQSRCEAILEQRGETDEWVLALWAWWRRSTLEDRDRLAEEIATIAPVLRAAQRDGFLAGPADEAAAARHLLAALDRMQAILRMG